MVASAQPWWRAVAEAAGTTLAGTEATGGLSRALAYVVLAGTLLVLVLQRRGRRAVAVLLAAVGVAMSVLGAVRLPPSTAAVRAKLRRVSLDEQYAVTPTLWPFVFGLAGLLVLTGAVLLWRAAPHWPARRDRFDRTGSNTVVTAADDPAQVWRAMDAGLDPTDSDEHEHPDQAPGQVGPAHDPVVRIRGSGDTMGARTEQHPLPSPATPLPDQLSGAGQSPRTVGPSAEPE